MGAPAVHGVGAGEGAPAQGPRDHVRSAAAEGAAASEALWLHAAVRTATKGAGGRSGPDDGSGTCQTGGTAWGGVVQAGEPRAGRAARTGRSSRAPRAGRGK